MCIICKDLENLTDEEVMRNIGEALISTNDPDKIKHLMDISNNLLDKDMPMEDTDLGSDAHSLARYNQNED